jgi:arylsulfatase A-like enzyme
MRRAGYNTAVAGKWQLTLLAQDLEHPHRLGFDEYCLFGWHEGARYHDPLIWQNGNKKADTAGQYGPHFYTEFLIDFMRRNRAKPFFAFYSMALCHDVTDDLDKPVTYVPGKDRYLNYGEMVASMDHCVGRIVTAVEKLGLQRKTLIIFSGDNGTPRQSIIRAERTDDEPKKWTYLRDPVFCEINGQRVPGGKGSLTDSGTRVPLLASWPGTIKPGETVDDLVDFSDFLPTLSDLCGGTIPADVKLDGISMAARLTGTGSGVRQWSYSESKNRFWVRTQQWKLLNTGEFFDVASDPQESNNLAGAELPAEAKAVKQRLEKSLATLGQQSTDAVRRVSGERKP